MARKFGDHTLRAVRSGKIELPPELSYLARIKYQRIVERSVNGTRTWCVEVKGTWLKDLLTAKRRLVHAQRDLLNIMKENERLVSDSRALQERMNMLQAANDTILKNSADDDGRDHFVRSPKNYLMVAEERGLKVTNTRPLQGGSAGLEKK